MDKARKNTLSLLFNIFILFGITHTVIDPLIPVVSQRLSIGYDKIGLILFGSSAFSLLATFLAGRLSDKYNLKKIIATGLLMIFAGFFIFGIYFSFAVFILTVIFFRSGCGIIDSSGHAYTAKLFYKNHSQVFLKMDLYWYTGAVIGPITISLFLFFDIDPGYAFLMFCIIALAIIILFYKYCSNLKPVLEKNDNEEQQENIKIKKQKRFSDYINIIKNPIIICSCFGLFFYIGIFSVLSTWLTAYFVEIGVAVTFGSVILSGFWAFNALGVFLTTKIMSRTNETSLLLLYSIIGGVSALIYSIVPVIFIKIIFLVFQAIFFSSFFPLLTSVAVHEDARASGTILGITISISVIGLVVFQPLSGYLMEYFGRQGINYLLITIAAMSFLSALFLFKLVTIKYKSSFIFPI